MSTETIILVTLSFLLISCLYSLAGFGGGSSYLAILSLAFHDFQAIRSNALLCNIAVVGIGCWMAHQEGKLQWRKVIPYAVFSVPAAFIGAQIRLSDRAFFIVLGISLIFSAFALLMQSRQTRMAGRPKPALLTSFTGGGIGFLSGMVGIGGGIFLSPILNLIRWENAHHVARIASFFILVNSIAGIAGLTLTKTFKASWQISSILLVSVMLGGCVGASISIKKLNDALVKKITAILVMAVGIRLLLIHGFQL